MILAIDIGNTNTVTGDIDEIKTYFIEWVTTDQGRTDMEYAVGFRNILEMHQVDITSIEGAILSSMVPPVNSTILGTVGKVTGNRSLLVGSDMKTNMNVIMDNPKTVGSDQIANAMAASHEYPPLLVVTDMGMTTMLCIVDKRGNYASGVIFPGLRVSLNSPSDKTVQLPYISLKVPSHVTGKSTVDCIRSDIICGSVGMMDGVLNRMEKELGEPPTIIAADGLAKPVTPLCRRKILVGDALLLKGLLISYRKNMEVH